MTREWKLAERAGRVIEDSLALLAAQAGAQHVKLDQGEALLVVAVGPLRDAILALLEGRQAHPPDGRLEALEAGAKTRRERRAAIDRDELAHAEGMHDGLPREGCPECSARNGLGS